MPNPIPEALTRPWDMPASALCRGVSKSSWSLNFMCTVFAPRVLLIGLGIDIAEVEAWLSGEQDEQQFQH